MELSDIQAYKAYKSNPNNTLDFDNAVINAVNNNVAYVTLDKGDYSIERLQIIIDKGYTVEDNSISNPLNQTYTVSGW